MITQPTDEEIRAWAARHDLQGSLTDLRCAFEDAATLYIERQAARGEVVAHCMAVQRIIDAALALISDAEEFETADGLVNAAQLHLWHALEDAIEMVGPSEIINCTLPPPRAVTDEMVELVAEYLRQKGWTTGGDYVEDFLPDVRAALQSIAQPITSVSDALNFLDEWALSGKTLHDDDIQRFHAAVERIAPSSGVPEKMCMYSSGGTTYCHDYKVGDQIIAAYEEYARGWNACREAMLSAAPAYNGKKEG